MASLCNPPSLTIAIPKVDMLSIIEEALSALGISLPQLPTIPLPPGFCPLDALPLPPIP